MASNKTPNLGLDIWQPDDYFKRSEINTNFTKVDNKAAEHAEKIDKLLKKTAEIGIDEFPRYAGELDDSNRIQRALNAIVATGKRGVLKLNGLNLTLASKISPDIAYVSINGGGAVFDASKVNNGPVIDVKSSVLIAGIPALSQTTSFFSDFSLEGDSTLSRGKNGVTGIQFDSAGIESTAHFLLNKISVAYFEKDIVFNNKAYIINSFGCTFSKAKIAVHSMLGSDSGERLSFFGCTFANSDLLIKGENINGSLHFDTCSFDYASKNFEISGTQAFLSNCHIETAANKPTTALFSINGSGGLICIKGGKLIFGSQTPTYPYVFDIQTQQDRGGGVVLDSVFLFNINPTSGVWATGNGYIDIPQWFGYDTHQLSGIISKNNSLLIDGGFEQSTLKDNWFISTDTSTITNKLTGTSLNLTLSTEISKVGAQSLKISKTAGGGSSAVFALAIPITYRASRFSPMFDYIKKGSGTGNAYVELKWGVVENDASAIPKLKHTTSPISSRTITFTSADETSWTNVLLSPKTRRPAWATHIVLTFNISALSNGTTFFIDEAIVDVM